MEPGRFRHRVKILTFTTSRDPSGQPVESWTSGNTVPAEVKGISGREQLSGGAETAQATIRVWMRFRSELNASSRLEVLSGPYKGQVLNIIGPPVANATATRLEILCKTGAEK
ncbi:MULTISPECIES: phage head closure protein [Enterobacter]|uniref:phage head closure protein n=1 Tax=Enterobacter TaxID=547 RepID=UPI00190BAFA3|nr:MULTISPECIES: phage head closure protein [Enterobacter]EHF8232298.1 phage head closure protein [Enterobacter roggenkampii]EKY3996219.1 phage head closure protein [Enterobacter roggenkampii]ELS5727074.1 phage head closure protein [Enterobacter roggenkampii]MBK4125951.1 phage head closure protein [Enterobacter roggenkampii]MDR0172083.1 phage head closure protein [Enterobacter sichuanensis]